MAGTRGSRWLIAVALLLTVPLAGCELPGQKEPAAQAAEPAEEGDSWILVTEGDPPAEKPRAAPPRAEPEEKLPLPPPAEPAEGVELDALCVGAVQQGTINGLTVVPDATAATVSWYNVGDPATVSYRLAAVPQRLVTGTQRELDWMTIAPGEGCRTMTARVGGLEQGEPYIFWLEAVTEGRAGDGTRSSTVGRSEVVYTR